MRPAGPPADDHDEVELGYVSGVFGVRGEVRLHIFNRESELLDVWRDVILVRPDGERMAARLKARPGAGKRVLGRIEGVSDRDAAAALQGMRLFIAADALPPLDDGEFYVRDVVGLPVFIGEQRVGRVLELHATAGGDVLEINVPGGPVFVPCVSAFVQTIDVVGKRVVLEPGAIEE